jgi:septal ring factor EnvC (AmiA/AmiB activator)
MNFKTIKAFNQSLDLIHNNFKEVSKAIKENTTEFKKITKRIEKVEEEAIEPWDELDPYTEDSKRPLAKSTPPAIELEDEAILMRKLDII